MGQLNLILVVLTFVIVVKGTTPPVPCTNDTGCAPGQCCYIKPQFEVVSKRGNSPIALALLPSPPLPPHTGICENYKLMGDYCDMLEKMNGHCGCVSGLSCQWVQLGIPPTIATYRSPDINHQGPGYYQCL